MTADFAFSTAAKKTYKKIDAQDVQELFYFRKNDLVLS